MVWTVFSSTIRGRNKTHCQDAACAIKVGDMILLAVADGLGSHRYSELGSRHAIQEVRSVSIDLLKSSRTTSQICEAVFSASTVNWNRWALSLEGIGPNRPNRSNVQTTFAIAVVRSDTVSVASIGDSLLFLQHGDGPFHSLLHSTNRGDGVDTIGSLQVGVAPQYFNIHDPNVSKLVLCTDGVERLLRRQNNYKNTGFTFSYVHPSLLIAIENTDFRNGNSKRDFIADIKCGLIDQQGSKGDDIGISIALKR